MMRSSFLVLGLLCLMAGCAINSDIVVVTSAMKQGANANSSGLDDFGVQPAGQLYWVEGTVRNSGSEEAKNVEITFVGVDGGKKRSLFIAKVASIPPGATVPFHTAPTFSAIAIGLAPDEPEITLAK